MSYLINPYWYAAAGGIPYYQELGRTSGSGTDSITVSSFSSKPYLMILSSLVATGGTISGGDLKFNSSTGSEYARRYSTNGATDVTATSQTVLHGVGTSSQTQWVPWFISNSADEEKLVQTTGAYQSGSGSSNEPNYRDIAGKWDNTSDAITTVEVINNGSGDFSTDSEVVVLGYDPADTTGTTFWDLLIKTSASGSSTTLDSGAFTSKKFLWVQAFGTTGASNMDDIGFRANSDSSANYSRRGSLNGGADFTSNNQDYIRFSGGAAAGNDIFINAFIINISDQEKLFIMKINRNKTLGASSIVDSAETIGKWDITASAISSLQLINSANNWTTDSYISVWGHD